MLRTTFARKVGSRAGSPHLELHLKNYMNHSKIKVSLALSAVFCLTILLPAADSLVPVSERDDIAEAAQKELAALQGTWRIMTHEENGLDYSYGDNFQLYVVEKNKFTVRKREGVLGEGTIAMDVTKSPKQLDFRFTTGQTDVIIYIRVGDYWIQCGNRDGKTRPAEFATGTPNGGACLLVLKREKPAR